MPEKFDIKEILSSTTIKEHPEDFLIVYIDPREISIARKLLCDIGPWASVTYSPEEVSLVIEESKWNKMRYAFDNYKVSEPYRLLTFDIVLDLSIVGFLSVVSRVLADSGVSIYALSTYLKDHILVKKSDLEKAVNALNAVVGH